MQAARNLLHASEEWLARVTKLAGQPRVIFHRMGKLKIVAQPRLQANLAHVHRLKYASLRQLRISLTVITHQRLAARVKSQSIRWTNETTRMQLRQPYPTQITWHPWSGWSPTSRQQPRSNHSKTSFPPWATWDRRQRTSRLFPRITQLLNTSSTRRARRCSIQIDRNAYRVLAPYKAVTQPTRSQKRGPKSDGVTQDSLWSTWMPICKISKVARLGPPISPQMSAPLPSWTTSQTKA